MNLASFELRIMSEKRTTDLELEGLNLMDDMSRYVSLRNGGDNGSVEDRFKQRSKSVPADLDSLGIGPSMLVGESGKDIVYSDGKADNIIEAQVIQDNDGKSLSEHNVTNDSDQMGNPSKTSTWKKLRKFVKRPLNWMVQRKSENLGSAVNGQRSRRSSVESVCDDVHKHGRVIGQETRSVESVVSQVVGQSGECISQKDDPVENVNNEQVDTEDDGKSLSQSNGTSVNNHQVEIRRKTSTWKKLRKFFKRPLSWIRPRQLENSGTEVNGLENHRLSVERGCDDAHKNECVTDQNTYLVETVDSQTVEQSEVDIGQNIDAAGSIEDLPVDLDNVSESLSKENVTSVNGQVKMRRRTSNWKKLGKFAKRPLSWKVQRKSENLGADVNGLGSRRSSVERVCDDAPENGYVTDQNMHAVESVVPQAVGRSEEGVGQKDDATESLSDVQVDTEDDGKALSESNVTSVTSQVETRSKTSAWKKFRKFVKRPLVRIASRRSGNSEAVGTGAGSRESTMERQRGDVQVIECVSVDNTHFAGSVVGGPEEAIGQNDRAVGHLGDDDQDNVKTTLSEDNVNGVSNPMELH